MESLIEENKRLKDIIRLLREDNYWFLVDSWYQNEYPDKGSDYNKVLTLIDCKVSVLHVGTCDYREFVNESLKNAIKFLKNEIYFIERDNRVYSKDPLCDGKISKDEVIKLIKNESYVCKECQEILLKACDEIFK